MTADRGGRCIDDQRNLGVGVVGVRLIAALVDDSHSGHVESAVVAGQGGQQAVGSDVVDAMQVGQRAGVGDEPGGGGVDPDSVLEGAGGAGKRGGRIGTDVLGVL